METSREQVAELEWANYAAMVPSAEVTPGLEVVLRDDLILTSSRAFPTADTNHACLLRASPQTGDALIEEVTDYFQSKDLPVAVYVSPACAPGDLPERLSEYGFVKQGEEEAWMAAMPHAFRASPTSPDVTVRQITQDEVLVFAEVFLKAFGQPTSFAPRMARLLEPSVGLPGTNHYLAFHDGEPIGTASLLCFEDKGIFGGTGVIPRYRQSGAGTNLAAKVKKEAKREGIRLLVLQTTADTWLEEQLRIHGFERLFTRSCYILAS